MEILPEKATYAILIYPLVHQYHNQKTSTVLVDDKVKCRKKKKRNKNVKLRYRTGNLSEKERKKEERIESVAPPSTI